MDDSRLFSLLVSSSEFQDSIKSAVNAALDEREATQPKTPTFYTETEACKILRISKPTCFKYRKLGILTASKVGSRLLFTEENIQAAISEITVEKFKRR